MIFLWGFSSVFKFFYGFFSVFKFFYGFFSVLNDSRLVTSI